MKKIILFIFAIVLMSCYWSPSSGEKEAVKQKCIPLCEKLLGGSYKVSAATNGFGDVLNYICECYPVSGPAVPIKIEIDKNEISY